MAKLTAIPEAAIVSGFRGVIDYYVHDGQPCARRWPRSPGKRRAPAVEAQWPDFSYTAKTWGHLSPEVQAAWNAMAIATMKTGKDLFQQNFLTNLYINPNE